MESGEKESGSENSGGTAFEIREVIIIMSSQVCKAGKCIFDVKNILFLSHRSQHAQDPQTILEGLSQH